MDIALICSLKDPASVNMNHGFAFFEETRERFQGCLVYQYRLSPHMLRLYTVEDELLSMAVFPKADLLIFLSKHRSKENTPNFTIHAPGNWGNAEFGGRTGTLCQTSSFLLKSLFIEISKTAGLPVTMEPTHHGPYAETPSIFVEIGSNENAWNDKLAADVLADVVYDLIAKTARAKGISAIGLGGNHYSPKFQKMIETQNYAFGHICPKHKLDSLDDKMILEMISKTIPKPEQAVLDWKGMNSSQRKKIIDMLERNGINWVRT